MGNGLPVVCIVKFDFFCIQVNAIWNPNVHDYILVIVISSLKESKRDGIVGSTPGSHSEGLRLRYPPRFCELDFELKV